MTTTADIERLSKKLDDDARVQLMALVDVEAAARKRMQAESTAATVRDWETARASLGKYVAELTGAEGGLRHKNRSAAAKFLQGRGYKIGRQKFYNDCKKGLCHVNPDGSISDTALERYVNRPESGLSQGVAVADVSDDMSELLRRKEHLNVRLLENKDRRDQFEMDRLHGLYILRADLEQELVGRYVALKAELMRRFTAAAVDLARLDAVALRRSLIDELNAGLTAFADTGSFHVIVETETNTQTEEIET